MAQHRDNNPMKPTQLGLKETVEWVDEIIAEMSKDIKRGIPPARLELVKRLRELSCEFYNNGKSNAIEIMERIAHSNLTADHIDRVINGEE